jgi:Cd2+/Zn2+-exporting ATPase
MDLKTMRTPGDPALTRIFVPAMDCPDEEKEIRAALSKLPSVESMTFHLFSRQVEVRHRGEVEPILDALLRIGMEDELRPEAPEAIRSLRDLGVAHIVLLTGDTAETARKAGAAAGIEFVEHGLLPDDKLARIRDLVAVHGATAMVGDGVNDAPALALATVGVAIAAAGSPAAMETADVALMTGDLRRIPTAVVLGRRMVSLVRQNVAASLAIKAVFLAMAMAGYASLWMAVLADMGTTLLVIFNGLRLLRARTANHQRA